MIVKCKNRFLSMSCLIAAVLYGTVFGQEVDEVADGTGSENRERRPKLYFIDKPIEIDTGFNDQVEWPITTGEAISEDDPQFIRRTNSIREYSQSIQAIELEGGVWDSGLIEDLATLGELQQRQGDHATAIETFDRVVHISRINNGLHTMDQIPALEQKIESYLEMGDWEQADLYYNYMFYIQQKTYGNTDPRIIPMLGRLANWNLRAFNIGFGEGLGSRLSSAQLLFDAAAKMVDVHFGRSDARYVDYQQSIANAAYLLSRHPELLNEMTTPEFRLDQDALRRKLIRSERSVPRGFQAGEEALLNIVTQRQIDDGISVPLAEANANLGDWYLMFDRRKAAAQMYANAWQIITELEDSEELLNEFFGHVIPLPTFLDAPTSLVFASGDGKDTQDLNVGFVDLRFDVTENGVVRNLEIVTGETEENSMILGRLQRQVRSSVFRPALKDGAAIRSNGSQFRYRYWY
ncbi:MAG: hypothetical protein ACJA2Q_000258 [Pseudohongiellaceae bacterium]|jgi:hypothetical protein